MILSSETWRAQAQAHADRARAATAAHVARRARREKHPVEDFLFEYYPFRPGQLARWHPGCGVGLADGHERGSWKDYRLDVDGVAWVNAPAFLARRGDFTRQTHALLTATAAREPHFACFGMHEWAMVYRSHAPRHALPLRLGAAGTDALLEEVGPRCTHFDAYRFFTPDAAPLNPVRPTRGTQVELEQPACLHAGMDLYKWAAMLGPLVPGDLLLDCFDHARATRVLDMEASPYDCRALGYGVVPVETAAGRAEYVRRQRDLAAAAAVLRARLVTALEAALASAETQRDNAPDTGGTEPAAAASDQAGA